MTRKWKALGLATFVVLALGALTAQGASAVNHQFRSVGTTVGTGAAALTLQVGAAGTVECTVEVEDTSDANVDTLTVTARFSGCTFGGQPATFNTNHCAFILSSDTTATEGKERANVEIECSEGTKIEVHTALCTITVSPQVIPHALEYKPDTSTTVNGIVSAKNIVTGKVRNTAAQPMNGCLSYPSGAVGTAGGNGTTKCYKDGSAGPLTGTNKTTPQGLTTEGGSTECSVE